MTTDLCDGALDVLDRDGLPVLLRAEDVGRNIVDHPRKSRLADAGIVRMAEEGLRGPPRTVPLVRRPAEQTHGNFKVVVEINEVAVEQELASLHRAPERLRPCDRVSPMIGPVKWHQR